MCHSHMNTYHKNELAKKEHRTKKKNIYLIIRLGLLVPPLKQILIEQIKFSALGTTSFPQI